jgi:hypothetical protein
MFLLLNFFVNGIIIIRDNDPTPPGGFTNLINNQPQGSQNHHLVGGPSFFAPFKTPRPFDTSPSPHASPVNVDSEDEVVRTEKRIMWTQDEDVRLVSSFSLFFQLSSNFICSHLILSINLLIVCRMRMKS